VVRAALFCVPEGLAYGREISRIWVRDDCTCNAWQADVAALNESDQTRPLSFAKCSQITTISILNANFNAFMNWIYLWVCVFSIAIKMLSDRNSREVPAHDLQGPSDPSKHPFGSSLFLRRWP
jgi:hypothetical protein